VPVKEAIDVVHRADDRCARSGVRRRGSGLNATKPNRGKKIDPASNDVVRYTDHLTKKHDDAVRGVGGARKAYSYKYTFNGFAAELSDAQAEKMRSLPGVLAVSKDVFYDMDTSSTPSFLGLNAPGGLWAQLGGTDNAGDGIIIGIIDSGIWPESLSFSDRTGLNGNASKDGKLSYHHMPVWHGKCENGEAFNASNCNQKLIGARHYNESFGGDAGIAADRPWEFNSPRDYNGHGTHTSSTAGGNFAVPATGPRPFSESSTAWPRTRGSRRTRHFGPPKMHRRQAVRPRISWRQSIRPSLTVSTSSTTPSAAR
jgi:subtilisin family serine protease